MPEAMIMQLYEQGLLKPIDLHFARLMQKLSEQSDQRLFLAAALVSKERREGHICLNLAEISGSSLCLAKDPAIFFVFPTLEDWVPVLRTSTVVGEPGQHKPLVLDQENRLYLYRYWEYQTRLAHSIQERLQEAEQAPDPEFFRSGLGRYFNENGKEEIDWQKVAAFTCLRKRFSIISGGPGTGKTYTVAKILALLLEQARGKALRIALVAPTGKGATRLQEIIKQVKSGLACPEQIKQLIPDEAKTIHRLLKAIPGSPYFQFNERDPLPLDILIVDEASMVDLALMSKLMQALPLTARVIILGDKDQLASVEAGAVFGDLCDTGARHMYSEIYGRELKAVTGYQVETGEENTSLQDCLALLKKSYRFGPESGIARLSRAVNEGDSDAALNLLQDKAAAGDIVWRKIPEPEKLQQALEDQVMGRFRECLQAGDAQEYLQCFERFRILCGLREGPYGIAAINPLIEKLLGQAGLIKPRERWYKGRPLLISRNDYNLELFNGDSGVVWPDPDAGHELRVCFQGVEGAFKKFHPLRIPEHETLYAMTVHKSQGSEFDEVLLVLPDRDAPVLTRELIYTALTRARQKVTIWGREEVLRTAINRRTERMSGLRDELWK